LATSSTPSTPVSRTYHPSAGNLNDRFVLRTMDRPYGLVSPTIRIELGRFVKPGVVINIGTDDAWTALSLTFAEAKQLARIMRTEIIDPQKKRRRTVHIDRRRTAVSTKIHEVNPLIAGLMKNGTEMCRLDRPMIEAVIDHIELLTHQRSAE